MGYLLWRIKDRYKDATMDLKFASEKVRKLIDKHLESLGINTKVESVSILSLEFQIKVDELNKTPKAKASEMEHAIRHHIKVNLDKDPALYTRFKDKLEAILNAYQERWDEIVSELSELRDEMAEGRSDDIEGITKIQAPFFEILKNAVTEPTDANIEEIKKLTVLIFPLLTETATINKFWEKTSEMKRTQGAIEQELYFSRVPGISGRSAELTTELMKLAKTREADLR